MLNDSTKARTQTAVEGSPSSRLGDVGERVAWWCLLVLVGLVPLLTTNISWGVRYEALTSDAVSLPRATVITMLAAFGMLAYLVAVVSGHARIRYHWTLGFGLAMAVWVSLSTLFSVSPATSVFGEWHRNEGLLAYGAYLTVSLLAVQTVTSIGRYRQVAWIASVSGSLVAAYGLVQFAALDPLIWLANSFGARMFSTFGNPDMFAGYLVFPLAMAAGLALHARTGWTSYCAWGMTSVIGSALLLTLVRGAWLASLVVITVLAVAAVSIGWRPRGAERWLLAGSIITAVVVAGTLGGQSQAGLSVVERVSSTFGNFAGGSIGERFEIWRIGVRSIGAHPLLGWGPDTFGYAFFTTADAQNWTALGSQLYHNNAHNLPIQLAVTIGIPGAALYLAFVVSGLITGLTRQSAVLKQMPGAFAGACGMLVVLLFGVSTPMVSVWLWLALGLIVVPSSRSVPTGPTVRALSVAGVTLAIASLILSASWLRADHVASGKFDSLSTGVRLAALEQAASMNPLPHSYRAEAAAVLEREWRTARRSGVPSSELKSLADATVDRYNLAVQHDPANGHTRLLQVVAMNLRARSFGEPTYVAEALASAQILVRDWPDVREAHTELARAYLLAGELEGAESSARTATRAYPAYDYGWITLGEILMVKNDRDGASHAVQTALELSPSDADALRLMRRLQDD